MSTMKPKPQDKNQKPSNPSSNNKPGQKNPNPSRPSK
jgi:hypothetical protein